MSIISPSNSGDASPIIKSKEDVIDLLSNETIDDKDDKNEELKEDDEVDVKKEDEELEEDEEDELEEDEENKEEDEDDDKEFELSVPVPKKVILKEYPDLFKKFPHLETAYYRDKQYSEIFPTVEDAKEASEKSENLDKFTADLMQGNTEVVLRTIKTADEEAFNTVADNYLSTLFKVDERAYYHVTKNLISEVVKGLASRAKEKDGEEADKLINAAITINELVFGTKEYVPSSKLSKKIDSPEADKIKKEREDFNRERLTIAQTDLSNRIDGSIRRTIDNNIDRNSVMTPYIKKNAIKDVLDNLESTISKDMSFRKSIIDPLWKKAFEDNYSRASLDKIEKAYLSKAKSLLPSLIKNANKEALKGMRGQVVIDRKGPIKPGSSTSSTSKSGQNNKKEIPKGMNPKDWLLAD